MAFTRLRDLTENSEFGQPGGGRAARKVSNSSIPLPARIITGLGAIHRHDAVIDEDRVTGIQTAV